MLAHFRPLMRVRILALTASALICLGCDQEPLKSLEPSLNSPSEQIRSDAQAPLRLERLLEDLARSLADPKLRAQVYSSIQASPARERKLHFRQFLKGKGLGIQQRLAAISGRTTGKLLTDLDALPEFEFYMPVAEHRRKWTGGSDLIVVGQLRESDTPIGFDLAGAPVAGLSLRAAPKTPVLVVVPVETSFMEAHARPVSSTAQIVARPSPQTPWDFRLAQVNFADDHEPWTKGDPEFEMHVFAANKQNQALGYEYYDAFGNLRVAYRFWGCIGEEATGFNRWNYDAWGAYKTYTGDARPVLAKDTDQNNYMDGYLVLAGTENDDPNPCGVGIAGFPSYGANSVDDDDRVFERGIVGGLQSVQFEYYQGANKVSVNFGLSTNLN